MHQRISSSPSSSTSSFLDFDPHGPKVSHVAQKQSRALRGLPPTPRKAFRPLPTLPGGLVCHLCRSPVTNLCLSYEPQKSTFKGFSGRAALFREVQNVTLSRPSIQLMATGAHTVQRASCMCGEYLGFKIVHVKFASEKWKESKFLLELGHLMEIPTYSTGRGSRSSSESDSSSDSGNDRPPTGV